MVAKRYKLYKRLAQHLDSDPAFCHMLGTAAASGGDRQAITNALWHALHIVEPTASLCATTTPIYRNFLTYCHRHIDELPCPSLASAVLDNAAGSKMLRTDRKLFVFSLGLNWKSEAQRHRQEAKITTIPQISVTCRARVYPPPNAIVADTQEIGAMWRKWVASRKLKDTRNKKRHPKLHILNEQLVTTLRQDQSAILVDESGAMSGVVWRDFVAQPSVLDSLVAIGKESAMEKISIRMTQVPSRWYSPGSHSGSKFDWAKNLRSKNLPKDVVMQMNYKTSSAFTFFWN
ncbi:hypothetical protein M378DRAFT_17359 [Amanita muscaria Koide BX008]|uniref:Uncharacterized protein n=1 Tax=Amanita muscaria (strain Koide BX008) TaxID=946122 RepID=A0A0C2WJ19_AMAMK|nr:hypothetical protein M378DRAFT_17359 [Amanita muscaria Koide BX008]